MDIPEKAAKPNPISSANFFSKHFLFWFWPIFRLGYKQTLSLDDLNDPAVEDQAKLNADALEKEWKKCIGADIARIRADNPEQVTFLQNGHASATTDMGTGHLKRALLKTFGFQFFQSLPLLFFTDCILKVIQPWFMLKLVRTFIEESRDEAAQYLYATGVCLSTLLITLTSNPCLFFLGRVCQRCRIALGSMIARKVLRLSACGDQTNSGDITTLACNDVATIEASLQQVPYLVIAPVQLLLFLWFLFVEFEISCLAGLGFIFLYMPFQYAYGVLSESYRKDIGERTGERTRVLSEVIDAIQSVKMYAWEFIFENIIGTRRKDEVTHLKKRSRLHALQMAVFLTSSRIVPFLTFSAFVLLGGPLTADRVFYALAVYNTMTHYMVFMLPGAIRAVGEIAGCLLRIESFLGLNEKPVNAQVYTTGATGTSNPRINFNRVSAEWEIGKPVLKELKMDLIGSKLVMVVGVLGSSKSSLLHAILNELHITAGAIFTEGNISYSPQDSTTLFPGSIRANILNTLAFDQSKYDDVLAAACLKEDVENLDGRDSRRVVGLSGGQKARVNLARALYRDADIYLLDDPLSAVDSGVSRQIFDSAIRGYLRNKLVILVTHQLQYLKEADHIIVMHEGQVKDQGSFPEVDRTIQDLFGQHAEARVDDLLVKGAVNGPINGPVNGPVGSPTAGLHEETSIEIDEEEEESQGKGALGWHIYWLYFHAGRSVPQLTCYLLIFLVAQVFTTLIEYWLAIWTNAEEAMFERELTFGNITMDIGNITKSTEDKPFTWQGFEHFLSNLHSLEQMHYLYVYLILTSIVFITNLAKAVAFFHYCMRISTKMHEKMLKSLLRAAPSFFETNTPGRIMNRFTKDINTIDELIPFAFFDMWTIFLQIGTVILLIVVAIWYSIVPVIVFLLMLSYVRQYYVTTSRDLKRIDAKTRSPVVTHLQATFNSLTTMRALGVEKELSRQFDTLQDLNTSATISFLAASQCFNIWIEILATILLTFVAFGFLLAQNYLGMNFLGGNVGLAICSAMSLTIWLQYGMKVSANVENLMVSVERALEYTKLPSEASLEDSGEKPSPNWPNTGHIRFDNITLSYKEGTNVLNNLSFEVEPCKKIGIVGKTGAGKSSVLRALFRLTELRKGRILVDGKNVGELGLHQLRKAMAIIPQEPKLFKGTLRFNLDPRTVQPGVPSISDDQMERILNKVGLKHRLDSELNNKGGNLCAGERQLVSIARAILLERRIVCLDEATANIDQATDRVIQQLLKDRLAGSTTITIAHRLGTVIESDAILVLHSGEKMEYGDPHTLLQNSAGMLTKMVENTGNETANELIRRACESWKQRNGYDHCKFHEAHHDI